ncbi:hypothetical protein K493DRAFT_374929 [Basidiobolus meristosporus CBS 931.73]|uniref:Uncharacterized protein n=1 Tax=Basidiobolus meristosporus CBS 931.73 TaxID=1314790 RepID=A0A1Y1Y6L7_9FUNG|nr:hypothetical protein K493DRAFT_374929 [Basidiobolus meristosporus CBS 931.73]|eukprot:ORX93628.1 hypothetical protein K493DRAFT_374929 [Basidiobolus meristosporus CBS 931.73]
MFSWHSNFRRFTQHLCSPLIILSLSAVAESFCCYNVITKATNEPSTYHISIQAYQSDIAHYNREYQTSIDFQGGSILREIPSSCVLRQSGNHYVCVQLGQELFSTKFTAFVPSDRTPYDPIIGASIRGERCERQSMCFPSNDAEASANLWNLGSIGSFSRPIVITAVIGLVILLLLVGFFIYKFNHPRKRDRRKENGDCFDDTEEAMLSPDTKATSSWWRRKNQSHFNKHDPVIGEKLNPDLVGEKFTGIPKLGKENLGASLERSLPFYRPHDAELKEEELFENGSESRNRSELRTSVILEMGWATSNSPPKFLEIPENPASIAKVEKWLESGRDTSRIEPALGSPKPLRRSKSDFFQPRGFSRPRHLQMPSESESEYSQSLGSEDGCSTLGPNDSASSVGRALTPRTNLQRSKTTPNIGYRRSVSKRMNQEPKPNDSGKAKGKMELTKRLVLRRSRSFESFHEFRRYIKQPTSHTLTSEKLTRKRTQQRPTPTQTRLGGYSSSSSSQGSKIYELRDMLTEIIPGNNDQSLSGLQVVLDETDDLEENLPLGIINPSKEDDLPLAALTMRSRTLPRNFGARNTKRLRTVASTGQLKWKNDTKDRSSNSENEDTLPLGFLLSSNVQDIIDLYTPNTE